ncbi:MAG: hypothetical protein LBP87_08490 [Planctomycetaceae bacterium]|jgi:hypothetical protein|nr:hypothetical protein [Planctomycetaceae bacterium]
MHNRRCSEAQPTETSNNTKQKPRMGRDYQPNNHNLALAGLRKIGVGVADP